MHVEYFEYFCDHHVLWWHGHGPQAAVRYRPEDDSEGCQLDLVSRVFLECFLVH